MQRYIYTPYLVYHPNSNTTYCIHLFIYPYIYISIYMFTGKTEKYRIFPKKSKKQKNSRRKTKTGRFPAKQPKNQSRYKYFEK